MQTSQAQVLFRLFHRDSDAVECKPQLIQVTFSGLLARLSANPFLTGRRSRGWRERVQTAANKPW